MPDSATVSTPALNRYTEFPFKVDAFPQDWLRQLCAFQPLATSSDAGALPDDGNHYEP